MNKLKIYIVDDDYFFINLIGHELSSKYDAEVRSFNTAKGCIEELKEEKPDIIFLDYNLDDYESDMNGKKALNIIKKIYPDQIVVMLSTQDNIDNLMECLDEGAYDYIIKSKFTSKLMEMLLKKLYKDKLPEKEGA